MVDVYSPHPSTPKKQDQKSLKINSRERRRRLDYALRSAFEREAPESESGMASAFCYYPKKVNFINQDPEEEIILLLRKHPITNVGWILTAIGLAILPAFLSVFPFFEALPFGFRIISTIVWYMIVFAFVLEEYLSWFFNVNIITDERIIEIDFLNLIYRELTDADIDNIEDVTVKVGGGIRTFANFGDVEIQTAAEIVQITFEAVPRPDVVTKVLRELRVEEEQERLEGRVR